VTKFVKLEILTALFLGVRQDVSLSIIERQAMSEAMSVIITVFVFAEVLNQFFVHPWP